MSRYRHYIQQTGQGAAYLFAFMIPISTSISSAAVILAVLMWFFSGQWAEKRKQCLSHPLNIGLMVVVSYFVITSFYSVAAPESLFSSLKDYLRLLYIPILMHYFRTPPQTYIAIALFIAAMLITFLLAVIKVYGGIPIGDQYNQASYTYSVSASIFKTHIQTNFFMAIATFFLIHWAVQRPTWRVVFGFLAALLTFYVLYMSWGRTGQVLFIALMLLLLLQLTRRWHLRCAGALIIVIGLAGVYASSETLQLRVAHIKQDINIYEAAGPLETSSVGSRIAFAKNSIALIARAPLWGSGVGSFATCYETTFPNAFYTDNPHNEYLLVGVEGGLVGLALLIGLIVLQYYCSLRLPPTIKPLAQGMIFAFFIGCFANSWLHDSTEASFYILMTACLFATFCPLKRDPHDTP